MISKYVQLSAQESVINVLHYVQHKMAKQLKDLSMNFLFLCNTKGQIKSNQAAMYADGRLISDDAA